MSGYNSQGWMRPSQIDDCYRKTKSRIRKIRKTLNKPIKKNGEPYAEGTIKGFKRRLNHLNKEKEHLEKVDKQLRSQGVNVYSCVEHPGLYDAQFYFCSWDYAGGLIKTKDLAQNGPGNTYDDIIKMAAFIFGQDTNCSEFKTSVYDCVLKNYIEILDGMISESAAKGDGRLKKGRSFYSSLEPPIDAKKEGRDLRERIRDLRKEVTSLEIEMGLPGQVDHVIQKKGNLISLDFEKS